MRPSDFELLRPWMYLFSFADESEGVQSSNCYAWTTHGMLRAAHWWTQSNSMVDNRVAKLFLSFFGNFDVVASKKLGRVALGSLADHAGASCSAHVLEDSDVEDGLPAESEPTDSRCLGR